MSSSTIEPSKRTSSRLKIWYATYLRSFFFGVLGLGGLGISRGHREEMPGHFLAGGACMYPQLLVAGCRLVCTCSRSLDSIGIGWFCTDRRSSRRCIQSSLPCCNNVLPSSHRRASPGRDWEVDSASPCKWTDLRKSAWRDSVTK